jgi:hypothetical protein
MFCCTQKSGRNSLSKKHQPATPGVNGCLVYGAWMDEGEMACPEGRIMRIEARPKQDFEGSAPNILLHRDGISTTQQSFNIFCKTLLNRDHFTMIHYQACSGLLVPKKHCFMLMTGLLPKTYSGIIYMMRWGLL